jgi:hypothetical protein
VLYDTDGHRRGLHTDGGAYTIQYCRLGDGDIMCRTGHDGIVHCEWGVPTTVVTMPWRTHSPDEVRERSYRSEGLRAADTTHGTQRSSAQAPPSVGTGVRSVNATLVCSRPEAGGHTSVGLTRVAVRPL